MLPLAWALLLAPIAILNVRHARGRATFDHACFHVPTIESMVATWPIAKLTYPEHFVAMTPGYHWVLAAISKGIGLSDGSLRLVGLLLGALCFGVVGTMLGRRCGPAWGALLLAPVLASVYVASSGAWVLADNAGWFWVAVLAWWALFTRPSMQWAVLMGTALLLAVWTRQNLLFLALPLWAAAWLREPPAGPTGTNPFRGMPTRVKNLLPMAMATLPAIASLVYLHRTWGGLVPPEFQGQYDGANPSNIALQFAMLSALGWFFLPAILSIGEAGWWMRIRALLRTSATSMLLGALLAAIIAALVPTTSAPEQGRAGLVWSLMDRLDLIGPLGQTNVLIVLAAAVGGGMLMLILSAVSPRRGWILAALFGGFLIAQGASSEAWQRYHEPFTLVFLACATAVAIHERRGRRDGLHRPQAIPIALLAGGLAISTSIVLWQREVAPWRRGESRVPTTQMHPDPPPAEQAPRASREPS